MKNELDFKKHPIKSLKELDEAYPADIVFIIEQIMASKNIFISVLQDLLDIMKYGFEVEKVRKKPIFYKFTKTDKKVKTMQLNHFISNLIFWQPLIDVDQVELLDESWIFNFSAFNSDTLMDYVNEKLLPVYNTDFASQNAMVDELYHHIISISHAFCLLMGMSVSLYDLHQVEMRNPEVYHLMRDGVDETLSPHEIEQELNARNKRLIEILATDSAENDYKPFFASKTALKEAQFREYAVRIGFKADINGNTVPIFIDNNFLFHGLTKPSYLYLNAISGRKALILSKLSMGQPGAFSRKLVYQSVTSKLREDYEKCDSVATVEYRINDDTFLKLLDGRYYYDARGNMKLLDYKKDKDLIGKIVRFRSPATCNSSDGVCKYCYGHMFDINKSMPSAGALAALKITEPIGQQVLSSKHSQSTSSNDLSFSDGYDEIFETNNSEITLKEDSELDADLYIKLNDVQVEEMDDSEFYSVTSFDVVDSSNKTIHHIEENSGAKFYLNDNMIEMYKQKIRMKNNSLVFALEDLDDEETLFTVEVKNKELTEPLKIFTRILNTNDHYGARTISEFCQIFAEKLIAMNIKYELVHAEMVIRSLIRKKSDILDFPDFSLSGNANDYQILKLNDGQLYHPSALVSLPYGYIRRQLLSTELYEKTSPGPLDALYMPQLSTFLN